MDWRAKIEAAFPAILRHEGVWSGVYRHLDPEGRVIDQHDAHVTCTFPDTGAFAYVQHNRFSWSDGRVATAELPAVLRGARLYWETPTFSGFAWDAGEGVVMLHLDRKDEPGAHFIEVIVLAPGGVRRARTWHWFKDGTLIRRTLCDEARV